MNHRKSRHADGLALAIAAAAVAAGSLLLLVTGAPVRMALMNVAALGVGLAAIMILRLLARAPVLTRSSDAAVVALSALVPLTALFGIATEGVARWIVIAAVTIQPALIVVPIVAVAFARAPSTPRLLAVACVAGGLALQADAGAAAMLALATLCPLLVRPRGPQTVAAAFIAGAALLLTVLRPVSLPPVSYVENVLSDAARGGPFPAMIAAIALILMFTPAAVPRARTRPAVALAFAGIWTGALAASIFGSYPTPILGFGGSAILGYLLSVGLLRDRRESPALLKPNPILPADAEQDAGDLRFA